MHRSGRFWPFYATVCPCFPYEHTGLIMTTFAEEPFGLSPDGALIRAYLAGDREAFAEVYQRYRPKLIGFLYGKVGNSTDAEELAQEAMSRALRSIETFDQRRSFWPWLRVIAANVLNGEWQRRSLEVLTAEIGDEPVTVDEADRIVTHAAVVAALAKIPKRHRRILVLRYVEDRAAKDLEAIFGLTRNGVEQLLLRARRSLRNAYKPPMLVVPGLSRLVARLRRSAADAGSRLQAVGGATSAFPGELVLGAALTVGGIGLAIGGGLAPRDAQDRATVAVASRSSSMVSYAPARAGGPLVVRGSAPGAALAGDGTDAALPGGAATLTDAAAPWEDGTDAGDELATPGEAGAATDGAGSAPESTTGHAQPEQPVAGWHDDPAPGAGPDDDAVVSVPNPAGSSGTTVVIDTEGESTVTSGGEDDTAQGDVALNRQIYAEGEVVKDEIAITVDDVTIAAEGSVTNSGSGGITCDNTGFCPLN